MKRWAWFGILFLITCTHVSFAGNQMLRPLKKAGCGLEKCHGMDFTCTRYPPEICTEMYAFGDLCRQFARCEAKDSKCSLVKNEKLDKCMTCMRDCKLEKDKLSIETGKYKMECDAQCRKLLNL